MAKNQILQLEPSRELKFKGSFTEPIPVELIMGNPSDLRVGFKIKTTAPKQYTVRPSSGIVNPGDAVVVTITLHPFDFDPMGKYSHKFMVQSLVVPEMLPSEEIEELWHADTGERMDTKLKCVLEQETEHKQDSTCSTAKRGEMDDFSIERKRLVDEIKMLKEEGSRLRQMIVSEQDRSQAVHFSMRNSRRSWTILLVVLFSLLGVAIGVGIAVYIQPRH